MTLAAFWVREQPYSASKKHNARNPCFFQSRNKSTQAFTLYYVLDRVVFHKIHTLAWHTQPLAIGDGAVLNGDRSNKLCGLLLNQKHLRGSEPHAVEKKWGALQLQETQNRVKGCNSFHWESHNFWFHSRFYWVGCVRCFFLRESFSQGFHIKSCHLHIYAKKHKHF